MAYKCHEVVSLKKMGRLLRRFYAPLLVAAAVLGLLGAFLCVRRADQAMTDEQPPYILIDAGHGGADGGAVGADGTQEKEINLAITQPLADILRVFGYAVVTTRDTDISIHDADVTGIKNQKVSDIHNRLELAQGSLVTISIHQNKFPQTQYSGTQVFYSANNPASEGLAAAIRESVLALLQPENNRHLKKAGESIYLLHNCTAPAVLVECGFLSNEQEREKLKTAEYQQKMAFAIAGGTLQYSP